MRLVFLLVTTGCTTVRSPPHGHGGPVGTDQCTRDADCPNPTPYCCDIADDGIGSDCFEHDFIYGDQEYCGDDECTRDRDCPASKPYCCALPLTGTAVLGCFPDETYCY